MEKKNWNNWIRRLGFAGFMFFLIKGLLWLVVIFGVTRASCGG